MAKTLTKPRISDPKQLTIIHVSDIHFGEHHRFSPGKAVGPGNLPMEGHPELIDALVNDLAGPDPDCPVIVCITGDLAEKSKPEEFREAEKFIKRLAQEKIFGRPRGLSNIFVVPGNHDTAFSATTVEDRWSPWTNFYNETFDKSFRPRDSRSRFSFHNRVDDLGAIILCLSSAEYVQQNTANERRGVINQDQLRKMKEFLNDIPSERLDSAIRIALIHHHPVLIPGLAENEEGYDAIENARFLLNELRKFGFHLILHGHKHSPYHFSEDSFTANLKQNSPPILIVAGGSAASTKLPELGQNCYNHLAVKWNPEARQTRILLRTRGLDIRDTNQHELLPSEWRWSSRLIDDRQYIGGPRAPQTIAASARDFSLPLDQHDEAQRIQRYANLRGNMPVCEVMPSLIPGQHNEVRLWIEFHRSPIPLPEERPVEVTWSAGRLHDVVNVRGESDDRFCATLHYYGPMLVQAKLTFADGHIAFGHVYARMPTAYQRPDGAIDIG